MSTKGCVDDAYVDIKTQLIARSNKMSMIDVNGESSIEQESLGVYWQSKTLNPFREVLAFEMLRVEFHLIWNLNVHYGFSELASQYIFFSRPHIWQKRYKTDIIVPGDSSRVEIFRPYSSSCTKIIGCLRFFKDIPFSRICHGHRLLFMASCEKNLWFIWRRGCPMASLKQPNNSDLKVLLQKFYEAFVSHKRKCLIEWLMVVQRAWKVGRHEKRSRSLV